MGVIVNLYSTKENEIKRFLSSFFGSNITLDNNENFKINMWVSLDEGFFINITDFNADKIIRYLYERYPY